MSETTAPISSWPPPGIKPYYSDDSVCIIHGDCREILPGLSPVDLVLKNSLQNSTYSDSKLDHDTLKNGEEMAGEEGRDRMALPQSELESGADGILLQRFSNGHDESVEATKRQIPWAGQDGRSKRAIQGRYTEHLLSLDDSKRQVCEVRNRREVSYPSQERKSPRQPSGESSDTLREPSQQLPSETLVAKEKILICTDPPYGISYDASHTKYKNGIDRGIASWDIEPFEPRVILDLNLPTILWGGNCFASRLPDHPGWLCWLKTARNEADIRQADMELAWTNFIRRSQTFRHLWIGAYRDSESGLQNMHPTQKPLALMLWCLKISGDHQTILDPFMGSGTTLRAAKDLGRRAIGIEIEEKYCEIAARRMAQEVLDFGKGG